MNMIRKSLLSLALVLFLTPLLSAQDLSSYRKFSLGTSLTALSKQVGQDLHHASLIHQTPAVIQELMYWPVESSYVASRTEPVSQILFSFYNGELYRIVVTYDQAAIEGLTEEDMVQAVSARYGTGTRMYPEIDFPSHDQYAPPEKVIARWEDSQNSISLFRTSMRNSFGLAILSRRLDALAEAAIAQSVKLEKEQAPQKELDRQQKEVADLDIARQKNRKSFRP
jgi:hypothetical protein